MSEAATTEVPRGRTNRIGLSIQDYQGMPSTLCKGCGHDVITNTIVSAFYEMGVEPHRVAKLSGIGCSSKTTAYFMNQAWGFNAVHGRMPAVSTGVALANRDLIQIGVSGDGDTASIGLGHFLHLLRRNVPVIYIMENNGVYGLTKGQFSATADAGARLKDGTMNDLPSIDLCRVAIQMGCGFVARSFSADRKQFLTLLKAAIAWKGTAFLDVLSPCVTFNNHPGSTKSYDWGRDHEGPVHELGFVAGWEAPEAELADGERIEVPLPSGGSIFVRRLDERMHDPRRLSDALALLATQGPDAAEFLTGLFYLAPSTSALADQMDLSETPLVQLPIEALRPSRSAFEEIIASWR